MKKLLRSIKGFTLSELLAAIAFLSLLSLVLAAGIPAAIRAKRQAVSSSEAQLLCSSLSSAVAEELRYATAPTNDSAGSAVFDSLSYGRAVSVSTAEINGKSIVTIGGYPVLGEKAYTGDLEAEISVVYDNAGCFVMNISIIDSSGHVWASSEQYVSALNSSLS